MPTTTQLKFIDLEGNPLAHKTVTLTGIYSPNVTGSFLSIGDSITEITDANGVATASLIPSIYRVKFDGVKGITKPFNISVPQSDSVVNAADLIVVDTDRPVTYTISSSDARYEQKNLPPVTISSNNNVNWLSGNVFTKTLTANTTMSFSGSTSGKTIIVKTAQSASSYLVKWPNNVLWGSSLSASAPAQTSGVGHSSMADVYTFMKIGSVIYANTVQGFIE
jgi:hypothetical protein